MRIKEVDTYMIVFDNGNTITFDHEQDCCENNFADFEQIEETALYHEFDEEMVFEAIDGSGFRFGNKNGLMIFVPCYSDQNGYYTDEIDIYYNGERVLTFDCEERID